MVVLFLKKYQERVILMREISITKVKPGQQLAQPVLSSLGGTIFNKGHEFTDKDYQILRAFLIQKVKIETVDENIVADDSKTKSVKQEESSQKIEKRSKIEVAYLEVIKQTEKIFLHIEGGMTPQILEIRKFLIPFVQKALTKPSLVLDILKFSNSRSYMAHHAVSVSILTSFLALKAGFPEKEIPQICLAGYLHNIGQLRIPPAILNKNMALTQEEFEEIQRHPVFGYELLRKTPGLSEGVILAALQHHEREDGSGYPHGIMAQDLHPYSKMISIVDIYYAMCSERAYKQAQSPFLVIEQLKNDSYGKLDPKYVYYFVELITSYLSIGAKVMLSNGVFGEVVYVDKNRPTKPMINCGGEIINLQLTKEIYIQHVEL